MSKRRRSGSKGKANKRNRGTAPAAGSSRSITEAGTDRKPAQPITGEDAALWAHVKATLDPLHAKTGRTKHRVTDGLSLSESDFLRAVHGAEVPLTERSIIPAPRALPTTWKPTPPPAQKPAPAAAEFDPRKARKIAAGRVEIDARIDLHGMRQHEAHAALRRFLAKCHQRESRTVLVITGKGATRARYDMDIADEFSWSASGDGQGVLRRVVPMWLREPDLAAIVVSYTAAHPRHGGEGALYVQLRRKRPQR